jgi:hypothetical protein
MKQKKIETHKVFDWRLFTLSDSLSSVPMKFWEIIADNLSKAGWSWGCVSAIDSNGRTIWIADAHRGDGNRFVVRSDEKRLWNSNRQLSLSVFLPFCKSERNSFSAGRITALDSGQRIAKRIHL